MKFKLNKKHLLISLFTVTTLGAISFGLVSSIDNNSKTNTLLTNASSSPIISNKVGQKVGPIRHWQNNNFSGLEVKNGGFVVLTGTDSATRIDSFGNILWEFSPSSLLNSNYQSANIFSGKKVVEIVQDETNNDVLYLLLVPTQVPNENKGIDEVDPFFYSNLSSNTANQAIVVQITENTYQYNGSNWSPSFVINSHLFINPKSMVDNYPSNWKTSQESIETESTGQNDFFSKVDHPSWYVTNSGDKVSPAPSTSGSEQQTTQESTVSGTTMVLPWKQYVTNLGNMYASNGNVFIFGGNGSIYNDPEALSIGVWKLNFNTGTSTGIPYAYILSGLSYSPSFSSSSSTPTKNWDKCYAPIAQTKDFHYVPRLAIGGIQTNVSSNDNLFIYLSGAITVGQIKNSQTREWNPNDSNNNTTITLQQKRSLQLSGQNIISNPQNPDRNSIDPCLLFGTALNINSLLNMPNRAKQEDFGSFDNILFSNQYFDIGTNMSYNAFAGTYYFFDDKKTSETTTTTTTTTTIQRNNAARRTFPYDFNPTIDTTGSSTTNQEAFPFGQVKVIKEIKHTPNSDVEYEGESKASYSYNLSLLVDNAKNYYYPTLSFGYSLKSLGSLVKVKMDGQLPENKGKVFYGYAMQVGKSILFINEPKFDSTSIVYRAPSTVSIGDNNTIGQAKYRNEQYYYQFRGWGSNNSFDNLPFSSCGYFMIDNQILSLGVTQYVAGIKDFNDTVPEITKSFTISNDPYADTSSVKNALGQPTLSWNNFKGLTFANNGESIGSSWFNKDTPNNNKLFVTVHPQLTEFSSSSLWSECFYTYNNNGNDHNTIQNQVWFEDVSSKYNNYPTSTTRALGTYEPVSKFRGPFLNDPSLQQADGGFYAANDTNLNNQMNVTLKLRNDSTNIGYIFGQSLSLTSKNTTNGLSYCTVDDQLMTYKIIPSLDRINILGQGQFVDTISNDFLSNSLSSILQTIPVSDLTNNLNDNGNVSILKSQFVSNVFKITKQPDTSGLTSQPKYGSVLIVATNIDLLKQSAKLTAYSWNKVLNCYDVMPSSASTFTTVSNSTFSGFSAMAEWILPVAIAAPIGFIALVIGMGCAIGIPMSKHRKSIRVGFELQHEKVNTLTTAVGGVFKKIIDTTSADKMKAKPQMLNSGGPKPASSPTSPKPNIGPKPTNPTPSAPKQFTNSVNKSVPPKPNISSKPSVNNSAPKPN